MTRSMTRCLPVRGIDGHFDELPFDNTCKTFDGGASRAFGIRTKLCLVLFHRDRRTKPATLLLEEAIYGYSVFSHSMITYNN